MLENFESKFLNLDKIKNLKGDVNEEQEKAEKAAHVQEKLDNYDTVTNSVYIIKKEYVPNDLIDLYESLRFSLPFVMYRSLNWWNFFDSIALYGHFINNIIIVYIAIYYNVNVVMCFNIMCVCLLYLISTIKLNNISHKIHQQSGLGK